MAPQNSNHQDFLFAEFQPTSAKEWKQNIQAELKGADYNQSLIWESLEGIKVKPFYHADETQYLKIPNAKSDFKIAQSFFIDDESIVNKIALEAVEKGVDCIIFVAKSGFDADVLLQNFDKSKVKNVVFQLHYFAPHFIKSLRASYPKLKIQIQNDPIGNLIATGNWFISEKQDIDQTGVLLSELTDENTLFVDASVYQNAGANIVQQVAYALAHANEYLNNYGNKIKGNMSFGFAMGSNFFFEIAKLRAFRYLFQELISAHSLKLSPTIFAKPTSRNKTLYDYNVNILRAATENMSAVLGGADVVSSMPYDAIFKKSNEFSERIARNQLILLKDENEFNKAQSYANGSYYIESLTIEIAKKALEIFQDIEKSKGFLHQIKEGVIQKKINASAEKEQTLFDNGQIILLGTNKYANPNDRMKNELELFPFIKKRGDKTEVKNIIPKRLAEKMEQERLEQE